MCQQRRQSETWFSFPIWYYVLNAGILFLSFFMQVAQRFSTTWARPGWGSRLQCSIPLCGRPTWPTWTVPFRPSTLASVCLPMLVVLFTSQWLIRASRKMFWLSIAESWKTSSSREACTFWTRCRCSFSSRAPHRTRGRARSLLCWLWLVRTPQKECGPAALCGIVRWSKEFLWSESRTWLDMIPTPDQGRQPEWSRHLDLKLGRCEVPTARHKLITFFVSQSASQLFCGSFSLFKERSGSLWPHPPGIAQGHERYCRWCGGHFRCSPKQALWLVLLV